MTGDFKGLLMRIALAYGLEHLELDVEEANLIGGQRPAPPAALPDPAAAVRAALEAPLHWPALRRALTPDDHVAIVVDEQLPRLAELLVPVLEHLVAASVTPEAVTLLCAPGPARQDWIQDLPDEFADVQVENHDPADRRRLSYLAALRNGRRLYLNRTAVDADQLVVFSRRCYDPVLGYSGAETALYPALADAATRKEFFGRPTLEPPGATAWPVQQEAREAAWLLGAPFFLQVIEGAGDAIAHVLGGSLDSSGEGQRLLDARWRVALDRPADVVLASLTGPPGRHDFAALSRALAAAARVVQPDGKIVLLTQAVPELGPESELLRRAENPRDVLQQLKRDQTPELAAAFLWASAVEKAHVYLLSGLEEEAVEEMFVTPLQHAGQAQKLLAGVSCLILPDAHKTLAVFDQQVC